MLIMADTPNSFIMKHKQRLGILGLGHLMNAVVVYGFDYGLYPLAIWQLGPIIGGSVMVVLSILLDLAIIKWYDRSKKDWLGIEIIKEVREGGGESRLEKLLQWMMKKGNAFLLIALSFKLNPFNVMLYMRYGAYRYNGMSARDWKIFITSTLIGNLYWTLVIFGGITLLEQVWKSFFGG